MITIENIFEIVEPIKEKLSPKAMDVYKGIILYINKKKQEGSEINPDKLERSFAVLNDYLAIDNLLPKTETPKTEIDYEKQYNLKGDFIPQKIAMLKTIHSKLGYPAKREKLIKIRAFCRDLSEQFGFSYSTCYNYLQKVFDVDNNLKN